MSFSWVDPHFAALFAQREEVRIADRLTRCLRERETYRETYTEYFGPAPSRGLSWFEQDMELRGRIRLI